MATFETSPIVEHLRREQANATRLYLLYKGYHWNVSGPFFGPLHALFDEHAKSVLATVDELAERQRMTGARAPYSLDELRTLQRLPPEGGPPQNDQEMIERLREAHLEIIGGLKSGIAAAEDLHDPGTVDLFIRTVQVHEKLEWFLREHLVGRNAPAEDTLVRTVSPSESAATSH